MLLLITCADVAGLLLARSVARARETAIRVALGARSGGSPFTTSWKDCWSRSLARRPASSQRGARPHRGRAGIGVHPARRRDCPRLDGRCSLPAAARCSPARSPAWRRCGRRFGPRRPTCSSDGVRATASAGSRRLSHSLVVAEIALAFTLLAVERHPRRALLNLSRVSPGFDPDHVLTFQLTAPDTVRRRPRARSVHQRFIAALEGIAGRQPAPRSPIGARSPAVASARRSTRRGAPEPRDGSASEPPHRQPRILSDAADSASQRAVPRRARHARGCCWRSSSTKRPRQDAIGRDRTRSVPTGAWATPDGDRFQVVGVVGDIRNDGLGQARRCPRSTCRARIDRHQPDAFIVRSAVAAGNAHPGGAPRHPERRTGASPSTTSR